MNYFGRELPKDEWRLVACGLKPLRPMTPEEKIAEEKRIRQEVEDIRRRPWRFFAALGFLAFSIWLVYWQLERGGAFIPIPPGFSS
jgi:hypothetical protein